MSGLTLKQRETLDRLYPEGWTVANWMDPKELLDPGDCRLEAFDNPNLFGACHYIVNGNSILLTRRGRFVGYYAWGGKQIPLRGERRAWNAIVTCANSSGHYGATMVPARTSITRIH